ncbi:hypothetical protein LK459_12475 [Gordonia otitidis]|uniref:hypothetical protein n=1 Tax=Gordonia otitidis TaxID=249058 RepID=UPI001D152C8F|nr:hypothetical protein [Gordonia otitidis]UEA57442.1 hypothetical protein LK459_12475 [Gordonia otitidis]
MAVAIWAPPHLGDWLMRPVCELPQHRNRTELILGKIIPRNVQSLNDEGFVPFGEIYGFEEVVADIHPYAG